MLADLGYAVFAMDLFGAGVRPTEVKDKRQHTGELYKDRGKMRTLMTGALETARGHGCRCRQCYCHGLLFRRGGCPRVGKVWSGPEGVCDLPRVV